MELVEENYKLEEVIKNLVTMIKPRAEKKNLKFNVTVEEDIENYLYSDSVRIRQIAVNFLTNAVKYTKIGGIEFNITKENIDNDTIELKMEIKDTGIGIREEDKNKLFKDFERFDEHENKNTEGTGLRLAITYKFTRCASCLVSLSNLTSCASKKSKPRLTNAELRMQNAELGGATEPLRKLSGRGAQSPAKPKTQAARLSLKRGGGFSFGYFHESNGLFATFWAGRK